MPFCSAVDDEDLRLYLPEALRGVGAIAAYQRLGGGTYNTGLQVRLEDGRDLVVKISPPSSAPRLSYEAGLLATEADYFRRTLPLGVPVPQVLALGAGAFPGRYHLAVTKLPGGPCYGLPAATDGPARAPLRRQLGRAVAQAHQARCEGFGYMFERDQLRATNWPDAFSRIMGALLDDAARFGTDLPRPAEEIRALVGAHRGALAEVQRPVLVHWDLWDGNVLVEDTDAGPVLTGLVDAERALHGDPVLEFPSLSVFNQQAGDPRFVINDDFLSGYSEVAGPLEVDEALRLRLALYRAYLYLVMLVEVTPRGIGGQQEHWRKTAGSAILARQLGYLEAHLR